MAKADYVYTFEEGNARMKDLLGGKGANLAEMTSVGLPVPPGFTITTEACTYYAREGELPPGLEKAVRDRMAWIEERTGKRFGDAADPLLVSVRSGAAISMPGMMDTILNLGLNDRTVEGLASATGDDRFAWDCYRRFIQMFGNVVMKLEIDVFEKMLDSEKKRLGVEHDVDLDAGALRRVVDGYKRLIEGRSGRPFPQDPDEQLVTAVTAVFRSWDNPRAVVYRKVNKIPDDMGTAVNVQAMVFGNMSPDSGTGVVFTRNPATGEKELYGEYLMNAQGEDVVAGLRTPKPISALEDENPEVYARLDRACSLLESHYGDMQDIEFTVERGRLYVLQTRTGKRTASAAVKIAVDLVEEGVIDVEEALLRIEPEQVTKLLHRNVDPSAEKDWLCAGLAASPGAACGRVVFSADDAERLGDEGERVILVRPETTPDDIHGIVKAQGILTSRGGMTCHAAIVARGMGKPCVVGCDAIRIDLDDECFAVNGGTTVKKGDVISIDGATGRVYMGEVPMVDPELGGEFKTLLEWCDAERRLGVRANADTAGDARRAREFGAEGIGLCRTEHMFTGEGRLPAMQRVIMAETEEEREEALEGLLPLQREDFTGILREMEGLPVTIRLLDPPLHEFLPDAGELSVEIERLKEVGARAEEIREKQELLRKARALEEFNPMLGHRGCRVGISHPEIYEMQARAIYEACAVLRAEGVDARPEVMIPLVGEARELSTIRERVLRVADEVERETGVELPRSVGTMIEVPRACLVAGAIAAEADFFSFGTNDLTQTTFGFSRDDAEAKFLHRYLKEGILPENPFAVLDADGVGALLRMAVRLGREAKPGLKIGICGEHGGDPTSIDFCHRAGLDYVSCSPYRVPVARLAAAQAAVRARRSSAA